MLSETQPHRPWADLSGFGAQAPARKLSQAFLASQRPVFFLGASVAFPSPSQNTGGILSKSWIPDAPFGWAFEWLVGLVASQIGEPRDFPFNQPKKGMINKTYASTSELEQKASSGLPLQNGQEKEFIIGIRVGSTA